MLLAIPLLFSPAPQTPCEGSCPIVLEQPPVSTNGYFSDAGCDLCNSPQAIAENFELTTEVTFCALQVHGGYFPGNIAVNDFFTVLVHADQGGFPGPTVYSEAGVASSRVLTGNVVFGADEWFYTLTLSATLTLPPGTYWLELYNDTGLGGDDWFWVTGSPTGGLFGAAYAPETPGQNWNPFDENLALVICGLNQADCGVRYCDETQNPNNVADIAISACDMSQGTFVALSGAPPGQFTYLLLGNGHNTISQPPGSAGDLCLVGGTCIGRYAGDLGKVDGAGDYQTDISNSISGGAGFGIPTCGGTIQSGETWNFQYWHRNPMGALSSFSAALEVTFQ